MSEIKKVRFGIIGTNFISDWVIRGGRQDHRFEITAIYSRSQQTADDFAAKHQIPHTFTSLEAMTSSPLIDAVYIASPNALHASQAIMFMKYGKHVLCEKAFASNVREIEKMIDTARKHNVTLMEAMKSTLTPNFLAARDALNEIGKIRCYFASYCQYSSRYDKFKEGIVLNAFQPDLSNGALMDIGIYTIYPMVVLFGRPQTIKAAGVRLSTGVDGEGCVTFGYPDMSAQIMYSKISNSLLPSEIQGENGNIIFDRINIISEVNVHFRNGEKKSITCPPEKDEYYYEVKEFIDLVLSGKQESTINSWKNSLITMEIMDEIRKQLGVVYPADKM